MRKRKFLLIVLSALTASGCAAPAETAQSAEPSAEETAQSTEKTTSETDGTPLLEFEAEQQGKEVVDLSGFSLLEVRVDHCEYPEPVQYISDPQIIAEVLDAVQGTRITGLYDNMNSTGDSESYILEDADKNVICSFTFQGGLYLGKDGRYSYTGKLQDIEGIMLEDEWSDYWDDEDEKKAEYEDTYKVSYPADIFKLSGYRQSILVTDIDASDINSIQISMKSGDIDSYTSNDPQEIEALYDAMCSMKAVKAKSNEISGPVWYIRIGYWVPDETFISSTYLTFSGNDLVSDISGSEMTYKLSGIDGLYDSVNTDIFKYLKEKQ